MNDEIAKIEGGTAPPPERKTRRITITKAAVRAKRAYFAALWSLWRIYDLHGDKPTGLLEEMEEVLKDRLRQSYRSLARAIGGAGRRRGADGRTVPSQSGLEIAAGILEYERKRVFAKKYGQARRAWIPEKPVDWSQTPPEWRAIAESLKAIEADAGQLAGSLGALHHWAGEEKTS
jgi:hypothetical protein